MYSQLVVTDCYVVLFTIPNRTQGRPLCCVLLLVVVVVAENGKCDTTLSNVILITRLNSN